jgi:hypothetical protein
MKYNKKASNLIHSSFATVVPKTSFGKTEQLNLADPPIVTVKRRGKAKTLKSTVNGAKL